ncbi:helix-turn-helix domain-containing protein [Streptomyces sp. NPDC001941]|uniref:TetR/AcrR family transcriptional regulator n=1 Tax=Streptomyces sp. NPDC001941 TaxID=3154659 RepID=UPI00332BE258
MSATTSSTPSPDPAGGRPRKRRPYAPRLPLAERREQLLDAALAVIVAEGYAGVTIDAVARRAGVARSVVYGAYDGLEALLGALLDRQQARAFTRLLDTLDGAGAPADPADFAAGAVLRMSAMLREDPDTWRLILLTSDATPAAVRERVEADRERFRGYVERAVTRLSADRADERFDARVLAHALTAAAEHFARLALGGDDAFTPERLAAQARALVRALWPPS